MQFAITLQIAQALVLNFGYLNWHEEWEDGENSHSNFNSVQLVSQLPWYSDETGWRDWIDEMITNIIL